MVLAPNKERILSNQERLAVRDLRTTLQELHPELCCELGRVSDEVVAYVANRILPMLEKD